MSKKLDKDGRVFGKEIIEEQFMVKYSGACKRNKDISVNCDGDCASCKVVNVETGKFDIYGFMEQATPMQLDDVANTEESCEKRGSEQTAKNYSYVKVEKNQFIKFLRKYPRRLAYNLCMDLLSFYDISLNEKPCQESKVAKIYCGEFSIREDILKEIENG